MDQIHTPVRKANDDYRLTADLVCGDEEAWRFLFQTYYVEIGSYFECNTICRKQIYKLYEDGHDCRYPTVVQMIDILGEDDREGGFCSPDPQKTYDIGLIRKLLNPTPQDWP